MSRSGTCAANLWRLKGIRLFFWMHFFAAVLIPFYTGWGGLKLSEVLFLNSWFMLWNFLLEAPTGTVADHLGRKASLAAGCLAAAGAALLYVTRPDFGVFLVAEVVFAASYTLLSGADEALAYDSLKHLGRQDEAVRTLASLESFKLGGIIVATMAGGFLSEWFGADAPMRFYALPALAAFVLACGLREPPAGAPRPARTSYLAVLREGGRLFLRDRTLLLLTAEMALTNALAWGLIWLFQPLLARAGMPVAFYGLVHAASCAGQIVFLGQAGRLERLAGSKRTLLVAATLVSAGAFVLLGLTANLAAVVLLIVLGFGFSLPRTSLLNAYLNPRIPSATRATVLSFMSMCRTLAIVAVNPLVGLLADWSVPGTMVALGLGLAAVGLGSRMEERHLGAGPGG